MNEEITLPEESQNSCFGDLLRERRESRGISLDEAVEGTRIRRLFLEAMEEDRFGDLPGDVYVTGFLRNYAEFLDLDANEVVECYQQRFKKPVIPDPEESAGGQLPFHPALQKRFLIPAGLFAAAVALFFLGRLLLLAPGEGEGEESTPAVVSGTEEPLSESVREPAAEQPVSQDFFPDEQSDAADAVVGTTPASVQSAADASPGEPVAGIPPGGAVLRIEALAAGWLEVTIDDRMVQRYRLQPGSVLSWKIQRVLHLETELPHQVKMWLNERPYDPGGRTALHLGPLPDNNG